MMNRFLMEALTTGATQTDSMDPMIVMIVGMAVVFIGLVILIGIVKLVSVVYRALSCEKKQSKQLPGTEPGKSEGGVKPSALTDKQRGEIIAAISCAIAENMGKPVSGIRIRSIRKVG